MSGSLIQRKGLPVINEVGTSSPGCQSDKSQSPEITKDKGSCVHECPVNGKARNSKLGRSQRLEFSESEKAQKLSGLPEPPQLVGPTQPNDYLQDAERMYEDKIHGPESLVFHEGVIYTGTADGAVVRLLDNGNVETVTQLGQPPCGSYYTEPTCGRPLGMRFDQHGFLIVIDTYLGLYKVNVHTGAYTQLLSPDTPIGGGRPAQFLNDLDIAPDGTMYLSDTSTYQWRDLMLDTLDGRAMGRLIEYNPVSNTSKVLLEGLHFANGVQLSRDGQYILVAETARARIVKYYLKGSKKGQSEIFIENLPGIPDNIRASSREGFWVALPVCRNAGNLINVFDLLGPRPWLRGYISKMPVPWLMSAVMPCGLVLEVDPSGNIVRSLMDQQGTTFSFISHAEEHQGVLYFGTMKNSYIGRLDLRSL